jgi:hypothetical protein
MLIDTARQICIHGAKCFNSNNVTEVYYIGGVIKYNVVCKLGGFKIIEAIFSNKRILSNLPIYTNAFHLVNV